MGPNMEADTTSRRNFWIWESVFGETESAKSKKDPKKLFCGFWLSDMTKFAKTIGEQQNSSIFYFRDTDRVQI